MIQPQLGFCRNDVVSYFVDHGEHSTDFEEQFSKWGGILSNAKRLRESKIGVFEGKTSLMDDSLFKIREFESIVS